MFGSVSLFGYVIHSAAGIRDAVFGRIIPVKWTLALACSNYLGDFKFMQVREIQIDQKEHENNVNDVSKSSRQI